ncbi:hypothetical protein YC2023_056224 [Brassica napus]
MIANRSSPTRALKHVINAMQTDGDHRRGAGRRLILESGSRRSTAEDGGDVSGPLCGGGGNSPAFWCCSNWMRPVFVGNFEYETRHSELERLFSKYGRVKRVDMNVKSKFERNQIMVELEAQVMTDTGAGLLFKEQEVEDVVLQ